jgi:hypothetical protein
MSRVFGSSYESILFDGKALEIVSGDAAELRSMEHQFSSLRRAGVVAYFPVETKGGMATIRFESSTAGNSFAKSIAKTSSLSRQRLIDLELQAGQPLANTARDNLRTALLPADRSIDAGKTVFIVDNAYYGLLPETLELNGGAVLSSSNLASALDTLSFLQETHIKPEDFTAFVGYPESDNDLKAIFKDQPTAQLATWKERVGEVRKLSEEFGFTLYGSTELNKLPNKEAVLKEIENSRGILWITAHSGGCRVRLAAGEAVEISASDVASLHLSKKPFVIVRACNGNEAGFAKAFISAGARAVWVNQGKILASEVNSQLREFLTASKQKTIAQAIETVKQSSPQAAHSSGLHVELVLPGVDHAPND